MKKLHSLADLLLWVGVFLYQKEDVELKKR